MKKLFMFFVAAVVCLGNLDAQGAIAVKKSASVKTQEKSALDSVTSGSLIPGVVGLVTNVAALNKQQKALDAECIPTSTELSWVEKMVKEYAKIGTVKPEDMLSGLCDGAQTYKASVAENKPLNMEPCSASKIKDDGKIWNGFPKPETATYCADGSVDNNCSGNKKKTVSNIYAIFGAINFDEEDYTADEINMYVKMKEKTQKCDPGQLSAKKKEAYVGFVKNAVVGAGTSTNTAGVWDAVSGLTSGGNGLSGVGNLAPTVLQFLGQ